MQGGARRGAATCRRARKARGSAVEREDWAGYDPRRGLHLHRDIVTSSCGAGEFREGGNTRLAFHGDSGAFLGIYLPTGQAAGDTVTTWLTALHMAAVWGLPFKVSMTLIGALVAMLSATGVIIWWKKRKARRWRKLAVRSPASESCKTCRN
ncbi:PepSY domain-containing protein [Sinorhizobium meliloti]|nr:PepSY-associated TM helix domain-containing protein [Sinorhizobium meliloti]WQP18077.1 PepSY-associated TM helix domain-containing protein [Sinorhizobium meliloti]WQP31540.1 PepSY-associated TM helix domain-containing protein [Sinorhizobium meliloti]